MEKIDSIQAKTKHRQWGFSSLRKCIIVNIKDVTHDTSFSYAQRTVYLLCATIGLGMFQGLFTYILLTKCEKNNNKSKDENIKSSLWM